MTTLILDTSNAYTLLAISYKGELQDSCTYLHQNKLSTLLAISIQNFLKKHDLSPSDLESIAVGIGPGSYTGTRVGVSVAKSFALGLEIPLVPFCSLLAYVPEETSGRFGFVMESKQGAPFLLEAEASASGFQEIDSCLVSASEEVNNIFKTIPYFAMNCESFHKAHPHFAILAPKQAQPSLQRLSRHLYSLLLNEQGIPFTRLDTLELLYLHSMDIMPIHAQVLCET